MRILSVRSLFIVVLISIIQNAYSVNSVKADDIYIDNYSFENEFIYDEIRTVEVEVRNISNKGFKDIDISIGKKSVENISLVSRKISNLPKERSVYITLEMGPFEKVFFEEKHNIEIILSNDDFKHVGSIDIFIMPKKYLWPAVGIILGLTLCVIIFVISKKMNSEDDDD